MSERYDIYFTGQLIDGRQPDQVKQNIGKIFGARGATLEQLFSGNPVRVKRGVNQDTAVKFRVAFRNAGALVEIRPAQQPAMEENPEQPSGTLSLLPPRSGSLADCAPTVVPATLPDVSDLALSPAGATIDESAPPPMLSIDTGDLSLYPPNSGSLEECARPVEPEPLPDISDLKLTGP
jgi:hypothetical protein